MKYVKKPILVEAFQFGVEEMPEWFSEKNYLVYDVAGKHSCLIPTIDGSHYAYRGDMIIKGIQGEIYPCKKDIFDATYDLVETEKPFKYPVIGSEDE